MLSVNLSSTFDVTRLAIPHLKRFDSGVIIVMSFLAGRFGYPNRIPYSPSSSDSVLVKPTRPHFEVQYGIRANAILPGAVEGPRIRRVFESRARATGKSAEEVAREALADQVGARLELPDPARLQGVCDGRSDRGIDATRPLDQADSRAFDLVCAYADEARARDSS